jgi:hypothetical protein
VSEGAEPSLPSQSQILRQLFLTLFLRGRGSRGLRKETAPKSIGSKLLIILGVYVFMGALSLVFLRQPVFALSVYLHASTLFFLGLFVASSAGEVLFNRDEGEILMHRPVNIRALLWAKISVLVQVSLWLAGAFNLVGLIVGIRAADGSWLFPLVHALSTALQALFCTGSVVLLYQLCLRWFGRERLEGVMTTMQVLMAVLIVVGSQILPQFIGRFGRQVVPAARSWWFMLLPPGWFAGIDDALAGSGSTRSWVLATMAIFVTGTILWLAFGKLAGSYETGLQTLSETLSPQSGRPRWLDRLVNSLLLRWWLKDSITRAGFLLVAAYLVRDRDTKLRFYPGLAPMLVLPLVFLFRDVGSGFSVALAGVYLGLIPLMGLDLLRYSQQHAAADIFRAAPMLGPVALWEGARRAVLVLLTLPTLFVVGLVICLVARKTASLPLLLPGVIALPIYALIPSLGGQVAPLSVPTEEAKSVRRGATTFGIMMLSAALAGVAAFAWSMGWFHLFLTGEIIVAIAFYGLMRAKLKSVRWEEF